MLVVDDMHSSKRYMGSTIMELYSYNKGKDQHCNIWQESILAADND